MITKKELGQDITVHSGVFHSDDVLCVILWIIVNLKHGVTVGWRRTRNPLEFTNVVADVGGGEFDHHNVEKYDKYYNKHCGASLLWDGGLDALLFPDDEDFAQEKRETFRREVVEPVSLEDNGERRTPSNPLAWVRQFNPSFDSGESEDDQFEKSVELGINIVEKIIDNINARAKAWVELDKLPKNQEILVLEKYLPDWQFRLNGTACRCLIYPSLDGGYAIIPKKSYGTPLVYIPDEWVTGEDTQEGMEFCQQAKFLVTFGNLFDALKAARWLCDIPEPEEIPEEELDLEEVFFREWIHSRKKRTYRGRR